jgi:hypothetical protein
MASRAERITASTSGIGAPYSGLATDRGRVTKSDARRGPVLAIQNGAPEREHRITTGGTSWPRQNGMSVLAIAGIIR